MDYDPISVALKFGFLAVLYLFLLWIARSALKDLRGTVAPAPDATGFHPVPSFEAAAPGQRCLAGGAEGGGGLRDGERFDLIGGLSIGRSGGRRICESRTAMPPACTRGSSPARGGPTSKT